MKRPSAFVFLRAPEGVPLQFKFIYGLKAPNFDHDLRRPTTFEQRTNLICRKTPGGAAEEGYLVTRVFSFNQHDFKGALASLNRRLEAVGYSMEWYNHMVETGALPESAWKGSDLQMEEWEMGSANLGNGEPGDALTRSANQRDKGEGSSNQHQGGRAELMGSQSQVNKTGKQKRSGGDRDDGSRSPPRNANRDGAGLPADKLFPEEEEETEDEEGPRGRKKTRKKVE